MRRSLRIGIGVLVLVACVAAVAGLMAPATSGAGGSGGGGGGGGQFCGGIAGIPCPEGFVCVEDPKIDCVADCSGICKRKR